MKIDVGNAAALCGALNKVNGRAVEHTANAFAVQCAASTAEKRMARFGVPKCHRVGATITMISGDTLGKAYKYRVIRTKYTLLRGTKKWFMVDCERYDGYNTIPSNNGDIVLPQEVIDDCVEALGFVARDEE